MIKSLLVTTVWLTCCFPALSQAVNDPGSPADHTRPTPPLQKKCPLKTSDAPAMYGFRLGMSLGQVVALFPDFPALSALTREGAVLLNLPAGAARTAVRAVKSQSGLIEIEVNTPCLVDRHAGKPEAISGGHLKLVVRDGRLVLICLIDSQSEKWKNLNEFIPEMSRRYGFREEWQRRRQQPPPSPPPGVSPDFFSKESEIECDDFRITFSCAGPPAPPGLCDLRLRIIDRRDP